MDILKIYFSKRDLLHYVLRGYPTNGAIAFRKSNGWYMNTIPKIFRGGVICFAKHNSRGKKMMNFPGPAEFTIPLKKYGTKEEFLKAYVFDSTKVYHIFHFDLDAREFLIK